MIVLAFGSVLVFCVAMVWLGIRSVAAWRATRLTPAAAVAVAALCGLAGILLVAGAEGFRFADPTKGGWVVPLGVGELFISTSTLGICVAVQIAFHPRSRAVAAAVFAAAMLLALHLALLTPSARLPDPFLRPSYLIGVVVRMACFAWAALELARYRIVVLHRKLRLGLVDPFVAHRILLWEIALGALAFAWAFVLATWVLGDAFLIHTAPVGLGLMGIAGVCFLLSLQPPAAYERAICARGLAARREDALDLWGLGEASAAEAPELFLNLICRGRARRSRRSSQAEQDSVLG